MFSAENSAISARLGLPFRLWSKGRERAGERQTLSRIGAVNTAAPQHRRGWNGSGAPLEIDPPLLGGGGSGPDGVTCVVISVMGNTMQGSEWVCEVVVVVCVWMSQK